MAEHARLKNEFMGESHDMAHLSLFQIICGKYEMIIFSPSGKY